MKMIKSCSGIASVLLFGGASAAGGWDYETLGADWNDLHHHLGDGDFEMCGGTLDQSPINIMPSEVVYDGAVCQPDFNWTVNYDHHDFHIVNNGHSITLTPVLEDAAGAYKDAVSGKNWTGTLGMGSFPNYFKPKGSDIDDFCLVQFHFHWGETDKSGSEHWIDDHQFPLEVHFVHLGCDSALELRPGIDGIADLKQSGEDYHTLAVVGVMFDVTDEPNPAFDTILSDDVLAAITQPNGWSIINNLYLHFLIDHAEVQTAGYYAYEGSLTTPPCTPIVRWHVSKSRSYIGKSQMGKLRDLMSTSNVTLAPNYREVQLRNPSTVYGCMEAPSSTPDERDPAVVAIVWVWMVIIILMMACLGGTCYYKSIRDARVSSLNEPEPKRQRLQSKSSIDHGGLRDDHVLHQTAGGHH